MNARVAPSRHGLITGPARIRELEREIERLRKRIAEMSALARSVRERVDVLIQMEIDEAGRAALAAYLK